jgi:hypothetical protein
VRKNEMKRVLLLTVAAGFLLFASSAFGQEEVPMTFNGWDGSSWDGGGTGFYYGSVNGTPVGPGYSSPGYLCDDFADEIYNPESWSAHAFQVSTLLSNWTGNGNNGTLFGSQIGETGYLEMAILVEAAYNGSLGRIDGLGATVDQLSEVLWCITGGPGSACSKSTMEATAYALWQYILNNHSGYTLSQFANLYLYVPINGTQSQGGQPQEMWGNVGVPEGGAALMYLLLAGISCFGAMFFRSRNQSSTRGMA